MKRSTAAQPQSCYFGDCLKRMGFLEQRGAKQGGAKQGGEQGGDEGEARDGREDSFDGFYFDDAIPNDLLVLEAVFGDDPGT